MATGRTLKRYMNYYQNGYGWCGYVQEFGPLGWEYSVADYTGICDAAQGGLPSRPSVTIGGVRGVFAADGSAAIHDILSASNGSAANVMIPMGIRGTPAAGDPVFAGQFIQSGYGVELDGGGVYLNLSYSMPAVSSALAYARPWGVLLHASGAETAVNTAVGLDDNGAATAFGGWMMYQIFSSNAAGTVTVKVQDAAVNNDGGFADLSGATSGAIAFGSIPASGIVALGTTATVRQYLRWQIALAGGATTATFALAFIRGKRPGD